MMTTQSHPENFVTADLSPEVGVQKLIETKVVDSEKGQIRYYQVQWHPTWESEQSLLKCCSHLIAEFWAQKAKPQQFDRTNEQSVIEFFTTNTQSGSCGSSILPAENKLAGFIPTVNIGQPSTIDSTFDCPKETSCDQTNLSVISTQDTFLKPTIRRPTRKRKLSQKAQNNSYTKFPSVQESDSSVAELDAEDIDEVEEEYLDFSDDSVELKEDSRDQDFQPGGGRESSSDEDFESGEEKEDKAKLKKKKTSGPKPRDKTPKRNCENRVKTCDKCGIEYSSRRCPTCSLVICKGCGIKYNNSFYKEKCRACTNRCLLCNQSFRKPSDVTRHMEAIHERVKKYNCSKCTKSFASKQYLSAHMETHREVAAFSCDICNRSYKTGRRLNRHKKTHTGSKPFQCSICNRQFHQKIALKTHMLTHSDGPKRFQCLLCRKGFNHKVSLKSHMLKHHDKNEQQAAVMIGLWKKYQKDEASTQDLSSVAQDDVLTKALNAVAMNPLDGEQALNSNPNFPFIGFEPM